MLFGKPQLDEMFSSDDSNMSHRSHGMHVVCQAEKPFPPRAVHDLYFMRKIEVLIQI